MSRAQFQAVSALFAAITPIPPYGNWIKDLQTRDALRAMDAHRTRDGNSAKLAGDWEGGSALQAVAGGRAVVFNIALNREAAAQVAEAAAGGEFIINPDRVRISKDAQRLLDGMDGSPKDDKISVTELAEGLRAEKLAVGGEGFALDDEIRFRPLVIPGTIGPVARLVADVVGSPVIKGSQFTVPFSLRSTTARRALPRIEWVLPNAERHPDFKQPLRPEEAKLDAVNYFVEQGSLKEKSTSLGPFTRYRPVSVAKARKMLELGRELYLDNGKTPIRTTAELEGQSAFREATFAHFEAIQAPRLRSNQLLVDRLKEKTMATDVKTRMENLPQLNAILDTTRVLEENPWLKDHDALDQFIRPLIASLNSGKTRVRIARDWQEDPGMSLTVFNTMALGHIVDNVEATMTRQINLLALLHPFIIKN